MKRLIEVFCLLLVFQLALALQCWVTQIWVFQYPLLVLAGYYLFNIIRWVILYKKSYVEGSAFFQSLELIQDRNQEQVQLPMLIRQRRKMLVRVIIEDCILTLTWVIMLIYSSKTIPIPFYACICPLFIAACLKLVLHRWPKSPCESLIHFWYLFVSISRVIILTFVLIKLDNVLSWSWSAILWAYWIIFGFLFLVSILMILLMFNAILSYCQEDVGYQVIAGSTWWFFTVAGVTISTFVSVYYIIEIYDYKNYEDTIYNIFTLVFFPTICYTVLMIILTLVLWNPLISWWDFFLYSNGHSELEDDIEGEGDDRPKEIKTVDVKHSIFLKRISDTFFREVSRHDKKKIAKMYRMEENKSTRDTNDVITSLQKNNIDIMQRHISNKLTKKVDLEIVGHIAKAASLGTAKDFDKITSTLHDPVHSRMLELRSIEAKDDAGFDQSLIQRVDNRGLSSIDSNHPNKDLAYLDREKILQQIRKRNREILNNAFGSANPSPKKGKWLNANAIAHAREEMKIEDTISMRSIAPENQTLKNKCNLWFENAPDAVLMDCCHGGICYSCACILIKIDQRCHFCRAAILSVLRIELSEQSREFIKVLAITAIDDEVGAENISKSLLLIENENSEESKGYYSEEESRSYSIMKRELSSPSHKNSYLRFNSRSPDKMKSFSIRNGFSQNRLYQNLIPMRKSIVSDLPSCARVDTIEQFRPIESSLASPQKALYNKDLERERFYLSSHRLSNKEPHMFGMVENSLSYLT